MLNDKSYIGIPVGKDVGYGTSNVTKITEDAGYNTPIVIAIGKDAGASLSKTYVCENENCNNNWIMFFVDSDNKICEECGETVERLTVEPRPSELKALRKKYGIEK